MSRLKKYYSQTIKPALQEKFGYKNPMKMPVVKKVIINMGVGEAARDKNALQDCIKELTLLAGQKPVVCCAKNSIAGFKLREGQPVGLKVTMRGVRMYEFLDRFFNIVCPRVRDFRGFKPKGDGRGSFSLGLEDQQVFPEINLDEVKRSQGMNITFVTTAQNDDECIELLRLLGMPFVDLPVIITVQNH